MAPPGCRRKYFIASVINGFRGLHGLLKKYELTVVPLGRRMCYVFTLQCSGQIWEQRNDIHVLKSSSGVSVAQVLQESPGTLYADPMLNPSFTLSGPVSGPAAGPSWGSGPESSGQQGICEASGFADCIPRILGFVTILTE